MASATKTPRFESRQDTPRLMAMFQDRGIDLSLLFGERLEDAPPVYRAGKLLGKGGMGSVYRADQASLRRQVAVKVLPKPGDFDTELVPRFVREAQLTAGLEHPNIVPVHDLGVDDQEQLYYTMKEVKGRSLQDVLDALRRKDGTTLRAFPLSRLLRIFSGVCDALAFAHDQEVIHRDLKPSNIMIGDFGEVLVLDWGLAKRLTDSAETEQLRVAELTVDGSVMGTPHYMAPEQAKSQLDQVGKQSDVYMLGGILHAILTLEPPVQGDSVQEVLMHLMRGEVASEEPPRGLPHLPGGTVPLPLWEVCLRALAAEPEGRHASVLELQEQLTDCARSGARELEEKGSFWMRQRHLIGLHPRTYGLVGLLMVTVLAIWIGLTLLLRAQKQEALTALEQERQNLAGWQTRGGEAAELLTSRARELADAGQLAAAASQAALATELDPRQQQAWYLRGLTALAERSMPAAHRFLQRAERGPSAAISEAAAELDDALRRLQDHTALSEREVEGLAELALEHGEEAVAEALRQPPETP